VPAIVNTDADNELMRLILTPEGRADPYPHYAALRAAAPVLRSMLGPIVLSRYDDCIAALRDPRLGRGTQLRAEGGIPALAMAGIDVDPETRQRFFGRAGNNMLFADPPEHSRLRRLVSRAFTPHRVEELRPAVARIAEDLLDDMAEHAENDVMDSLAFPLPVTVIGELVGVPASDRAGFRPLVRAAVAGIDPSAAAGGLEGALAAMDEMTDYFRDLADHRRREPTDDLLSALLHARDAGDALNDDEVIATAILLFVAGFETTTNLIGNGLLALLRHPDQLCRWREQPEMARSAVEELLRWDSPVQLNMRTALEPAEVGGEPVERGEMIIVLQGGANHDPERFADPDVLDIARADNHPLSFGWGIHHCIGAGLARMEGEVVFNALLSRFRSIELIHEPEWRPILTLRGLSSLHVSLAA
jgi:cytochrome P450